MPKSIDEILKDPQLNEILDRLETNKKSKKISNVDPDIKKFIEIVEWVKENGHEPVAAEYGSNERKLYSRLKGIKKRHSDDELAEYDPEHLLIKEAIPEYKTLKDKIDLNKKYDTLDDILNDDFGIFDELEIDKDLENKLHDTSKLKRKITVSTSNRARPKKMANFAPYERMFKKIQADLASGRRKLVRFKNYEIEEDRFYVLRGQLIYIDAIGDTFDANNNDRYKKKDARVHIIYENGTESMPLRNGLAASLYGSSKESNVKGMMVTDRLDSEVEIKNDDIVTGYIYVLKSLSNNSQISSIKNLYKIGFTTGSIEKRIANAENESTYLYAPVKEVMQFKVINLKAESLETAIHHALAQYQLDVDILGPNGRKIKPKEWFVVDLDTISEIVNEIVAKLQIG